MAAAAVLAFFLITAPSSPSTEHPTTWRVLVVNGGDVSLPAISRQEQALRVRLTDLAGGRVEFRSEALDAVSFDLANYESEVVALMRRKHEGSHFDLVMPLGNMALDFAERHRSELWPGVPIVFFSVGQDSTRGRRFGPGVTGVMIAFDVKGTLDLAVRMQPSARRVVTVVGAAAYDRSWRPELDAALRSHPELQVTSLGEGPLAVTLRDLAAVPAGSIVLYTSISRDGAGQPFVPANVAEDLARVSPAPIYAAVETFLGRGIVGGSITSFEAQGDRAAEIAYRVLSGEQPETIGVQPPPPSVAMVDWRQLHKWGLSEGALPEPSRIFFRPPSLWREYRWYVVGAVAILSVQTGLIVALLAQRRRRRRAEHEALRQRAELAHASRLSVVGELTASIAHEINQPLGAILSYAEAAEMLLEDAPGLENVRHILAEVRHEDLRASDVISHVRSLAHKGTPEVLPVDVNDVARDVLHLARHDAIRRGIELEAHISENLPIVQGDRIQLQQVVLNLVLNGMEAMSDTAVARSITIATAGNHGGVQIAVADTGPGIDPTALPRLFDSFFTTKKEGMGLGLSIARTIVEAHDGRIWAENNEGGGATFRIELPAAGRAEGVTGCT